MITNTQLLPSKVSQFCWVSFTCASVNTSLQQTAPDDMKGALKYTKKPHSAEKSILPLLLPKIQDDLMCLSTWPQSCDPKWQASSVCYTTWPEM